MEPQQTEQLKYPVGRFREPETYSPEFLGEAIATIENFPKKLRTETEFLSDAQLDTPYRENGWTIRQVVHHCADSHMNSIIRFKLALTENIPTIRPYYEDRFAELSDSEGFPIEASLKILQGLHQRWVALLKSLSEAELEKTFIHPEHSKALSLRVNIALYAWHCEHHLAHITSLKKRMGW